MRGLRYTLFAQLLRYVARVHMGSSVALLLTLRVGTRHAGSNRGVRARLVDVAESSQATRGARAVDELFTDHQSGKSRANRAGLLDALRYVRRGDTLRVASMDRLARSLIDLEQIVSDLTARKVSVEFVKERLTFSPAATADLFATFQRQLIGAVAELERYLIRERQRIDLAKARGVHKGRTRRLTDEQIAHVRQAAAAGEPKAKLAADLGVSGRLIYDVIAGNGSEVLTAHVLEPRVVTLERDGDVGRRARTVLGDDDLGLAGLLRLLVEVVVTVQQDHHVGVLLDRTRFTQVRHLRALVGALLGATVQLRDRDDGYLELLREQLERTRELRHLLLT